MPHLIIIAGPNGSGKTTTAPAILRDALDVVDYVNADVIAQGLSGFQPEKASIQAGRIMLKRIQKLSKEGLNFAFETPLASRSFTNLITRLKKTGYQFHLIFLWLENINLAISRVAERVKMGGHSIPQETIRRRYKVGLNNFFSLYKPISDSWQIYEYQPQSTKTYCIWNKSTRDLNITNKQIWNHLLESYHEQ